MKRFFFHFAFSLLPVAIVFFSGCGKKEPVTLLFYCDETFQDVMREEIRHFQRLYGVRIVLIPIFVPPPKAEPEPAETETQRHAPAPWRSRPQIHLSIAEQYVSLDPAIVGLIDSLGNTRTGELYLSDSPEQLDKLRSLALVSHEYSICYLEMVLLIARENPRQVRSLREALEKRLRIGIVTPSKSGMGGMAWNLIMNMPHSVSKGFPTESIVFFDFQTDLLSALKSGEIDAALAWDSLIRRTEHFADPIRLDDGRNDSIAGPEYRAAPQVLVSLNTAFDERYGRRFADFLISDKGREILRKHGFTPKPL